MRRSGLTASCVVLAFLASSCTPRAQPAVPNAELQRIFDEDQADRRRAPGTVDWNGVAQHDRVHKQRATELLASGAARTPEDFYRAAMIFQHGTDLGDAIKARELALRAVELRPDYAEAKWLVAAAVDRELVRAGKVQKYGTQFRKVGTRWELYPVDPDTTDVERRRWGVPTLEEANRTAAALNGER